MNSTADNPAHNEAIHTFAAALMQHLPYEPNNDQMTAIVAMAHFALIAPKRTAMILRGFAGTGKTSLAGAAVKAFEQFGLKCILLAPTGRAAHVFADFAERNAMTIHRKIYRQQSFASDSFVLNDNLHRQTIFLVDEASMIANGAADTASFGSGHLLDDLINYVYDNEHDCRLLLLGDTAQLPPVGTDNGPALDDGELQARGLNVISVTLRQIARQAQQSGILSNATELRKIIEQQLPVAPTLLTDGFDDVTTVTGNDLLETISDCYDRDGIEQTLVVTRSNHRAALFNQGIRNTILFREEELSGNDLLMVAKNNYFWAEEYDNVDFIANGDTIRVRRTFGEVEFRYGLRFTDAIISLTDHDDIEIEAKIMLDTLHNDTAALPADKQRQLLEQVWNELDGDRSKRVKELKKHPYYNALQVKYGYAVTCHKAQGGQWLNVFVDMGGIDPEATITTQYHRWLYTAISRAKQRLMLINYTTGDT